MLDDYMIEQQVLYKTIINSIKKDTISHAYLIETNNYSKSLDLAKSLAKVLLCKNHYSNNKKCENCNQCKNKKIFF